MPEKKQSIPKNRQSPTCPFASDSPERTKNRTSMVSPLFHPNCFWSDVFLIILDRHFPEQNTNRFLSLPAYFKLLNGSKAITLLQLSQLFFIGPPYFSIASEYVSFFMAILFVDKKSNSMFNFEFFDILFNPHRYSFRPFALRLNG